VSGTLFITVMVMVMLGLWLQATERLDEAPVHPYTQARRG